MKGTIHNMMGRPYATVTCPYCGAGGLQVDVPDQADGVKVGICNRCQGKVKLSYQMHRGGRRIPKRLQAMVGTDVRLIHEEQRRGVSPPTMVPVGTVLRVAAVVDAGKLCLYDPAAQAQHDRCWNCKGTGHDCVARVDFARVLPT